MSPELAALLGTLISTLGAVIIAIIQSRHNKQKSEPTLLLPPGVKVTPPKRSRRYFYLFVIFVIAGGVTGYFLGFLNNAKLFNSPSPTSVISTASTPFIIQSSTSIPIKTSISTSQFNTLILSDDFENGNKNFLLGGGSGSFRVVDDGIGNKVLELSEAGYYSLLVTFGPENISDFAIEYRVKIVSFDSKQNTSGVANLKRYTNFGGSEYTFSFDLHYQYPQFYYISPYEKIQGADYRIVDNKWYKIRVEMDGENLFASIDDVPVLKTTDSRLNSGKLGFQIYSNTIVYFDDVKVWTR
jgi:hypothetical protein